MFPYIKKKPIKPVTIQEHFFRRNKILIKRKYGGFGDIIMQRMMFEDFNNCFENADITYCCPRQYLEFAKNHPYAHALPIEEINEKDYGAVYDISTACRVHESRLGSKNTKNRSDIWANYCGIKLQNHNCHFSCDKTDFYKKCLHEINPNKKPIVLFVAKSTKCDFGQAKSLTSKQIIEVSNYLLNSGFFVFTIHNEPIQEFTDLGVAQFLNIECEAWKELVGASDYVVSVDTGTFHLAGALKKPLVGIFSFTDGKIYGKYYDFVLVQKHRDDGNWDCGPCFLCALCPKSKELQKPCITELQSKEIIQGFQKLCSAS